MSEPSAQAVTTPTLDPEDRTRADFYALLSRLYTAAPDAALLKAIADAGELPIAADDGPAADLAAAWRALRAASAATDPSAAVDEYQELFIGVGKSEVSLYASAYLASAGSSPLAEIRAALARLGLGRKTGVAIYEDHLAAVCEAMRALVGGTEGSPAHALADQRAFFEAHLAPWVFACCNAIRTCPLANYYRRVAEFTQSFMAIERDAFAIE
jgi:TorA maturation chaperone TorD